MGSLIPSGDGTYEAKFARASTGATAHLKTAVRKEEIAEEPEGQLTIDVYQTPTHIVIESAVAGVDPENIDVQVMNDSVTIRGERHREKEVKNEDYLYQECYWGRFSRSVILPQEVDAENAVASFSRNGVLKVMMPKLSRQRSRKLKVQLE